VLVVPVARGIELAGDDAAAGPGLALQHQHLLAGLGEIGGRDQAVVSGAHGDDVVGVAHDGLIERRVIPGRIRPASSMR
jgi:hypothetical protein